MWTCIALCIELYTVLTIEVVFPLIIVNQALYTDHDIIAPQMTKLLLPKMLEKFKGMV